jgi:dipeptidyl aminopeptidase/acylaminoacyl peptidase
MALIPEDSPMRLLLVSLCFALSLAPLALAAMKETHPFDVRDLIAFDRLSEPKISPDGRMVVFTSSALDLEANKRRSDLWIANIDGTELRRLTRHEASDTSASWAPDGRALYFLSTRGGSTQVWKLQLDGGEPQPVTSLPIDVGSFLLSPDGTKLALSMDVFPNTTVAETKKRLDADASKKATGKIYDGLFFRHWDAWGDGRRSHLFVMPAGGGEPVDVMKAMDADTPSKPFGGTEEYAFTPDGTGLVFSARDVGREEAWSTNFDLFHAKIDGSTPPVNLTKSNPAWDSYPVFSPDGKTLAYLAMKRPGYESDRFRIVVRSWPDGKDRVLTEAWERSPSSLAFSPSGKEIFGVTDDLGQSSLVAVDASSGAARTVWGKGHAQAPQPLASRVVFLLDSLKGPAELYSCTHDGRDLKKITSINDERLAAIRMGEPEQFTFKGALGDTVHAYLVKPVDFDPPRNTRSRS